MNINLPRFAATALSLAGAWFVSQTLWMATLAPTLVPTLA